MINTFCFTANDRRNLVDGHYYKNKVFTVAKNSIITEENLPADGIITTAKDLSIWNKNLHQGKILKPETYKLLTTPSVKSQHDVFGKEEMGYAYGIRIAEENGVKFLGHTGLGDGFASMNIYLPKAEVSVIVLENLMSEESDIYYFFEKAIKDIVLQSELIN